MYHPFKISPRKVVLKYIKNHNNFKIIAGMHSDKNLMKNEKLTEFCFRFKIS